VCLRIAKVDQQAITEVLCNAPLQALDHRGARGLVGADDLAQVFGVKLARQDRGVHQITEQHGELTTLRVRAVSLDVGEGGLWASWGRANSRFLDRQRC
jgi:hypothetical protein